MGIARARLLLKDFSSNLSHIYMWVPVSKYIILIKELIKAIYY